jgi:hypothetical protein
MKFNVALQIGLALGCKNVLYRESHGIDYVQGNSQRDFLVKVRSALNTANRVLIRQVTRLLQQGTRVSSVYLFTS